MAEGVRGASVWIYALVDPRTEVVRYVGQTVDVVRRCRAHFGAGAENRVAAWVKGLRAGGVEPRVDILAIAHSFEEANEIERVFICMHDATTFNRTAYSNHAKTWWTDGSREPAPRAVARDTDAYSGVAGEWLAETHEPLFARHPVSLTLGASLAEEVRLSTGARGRPRRDWMAPASPEGGV
jgi:hypothetical protein